MNNDGENDQEVEHRSNRGKHKFDIHSDLSESAQVFKHAEPRDKVDYSENLSLSFMMTFPSNLVYK